MTDMASDPDLKALMKTVARRQPAGAFWSSWAGRRLFWAYYMRILVYVTLGNLWAGSGPLRATSTY